MGGDSSRAFKRSILSTIVGRSVTISLSLFVFLSSCRRRCIYKDLLSCSNLFKLSYPALGPGKLVWICRRVVHSTRLAASISTRCPVPFRRTLSTAAEPCQNMSTWSLSVLTSATSDTQPTLLLNFGTAKYIFNASEGMGRAWMQSHHSIRRTKGLFVTAAGTHRCGGVPGVYASQLFHAYTSCKGLFAS